MADQSKYTQENIAEVRKSAEAWNEFMEWQKERIFIHLRKYHNKNTVKTQLDETGDLSPYQHYKINIVGDYSIETLERMKNGEYGICKYCRAEIPVERLLLIPAAVQCVSCDTKHPKK